MIGMHFLRVIRGYYDYCYDENGTCENLFYIYALQKIKNFW